MSKRFYDSEKFDRTWYRKLSPEMKCFWELMLCKCDCAGVWSPDFEFAAYMIGVPSFDPKTTLDAMKPQIDVLPDGRWWIRDFVTFQCGALSDKCKPHLKVIATLQKHGLLERVFKGYAKGTSTLEEEEEEKEKEEEEDKHKAKKPKSERVPASLAEVEAFAVEIKLPRGECAKFWDHFESNGWRVGGKAPMKSWKSALRTWKRRLDERKAADDDFKPRQFSADDVAAMFADDAEDGR